MKKSLTYYHIFVCSKLERLLLWLIYPIVSLITTMILVKHYHTPAGGLMVVLSSAVMIEIPLENYFFEGILSVKEKNMEYLKSVHKLEVILRGAILMSAIRRIIYYGMIIFVGGWYVRYVDRYDVFTSFMGIYMFCSILIITEAGTYLWGRYGKGNDTYGYLAGVACALINAVVFSLFLMAGIWSGISIVIAIVSYILVIVIKAGKIKKIIPKHYYDI